MKNLLTMKECAERLNLSRATLGKLIAKNSIGYYRVGLKIMFSEGHIADYLLSVEAPQAVRPVTIYSNEKESRDETTV